MPALHFCPGGVSENTLTKIRCKSKWTCRDAGCCNESAWEGIRGGAMSSYGKKMVARAAVFWLCAGMLAGCGSSGGKTKEGMQLVSELKYEEALARFDEALAAGENARVIARGKGIAHMGLTDYGQAIDCFREALSGSSGFVESMDFDINYYLAAAYAKSGRHGEAEAVYDAVLALRDGEKDAYLLRGSVRLAQGKYEDAKADFDKVLSMDAKNYDRLAQVYQALAHYGYGELGREYLQKALDGDEKTMTAYDKGRIYYYMGEYQKAALALEEAKAKGGAGSYLFLGKSYEASGEYNYAANVYNSYLAKDKQNAQMYNQLGLCEMAKQDYQKALGAFQNGMKQKDSGMMQALSFNEIMAYEHLGEYQKAAVLLEAYLKSYPDDEAAQREMRFLSSR